MLSPCRSARCGSQKAHAAGEIVDGILPGQPLRGRELWEAQAAQSTIDHRIILRWRPGVKRSTRVLLGNRKFEVQYIIDQGERHEWLQLMCRELEE